MHTCFDLLFLVFPYVREKEKRLRNIMYYVSLKKMAVTYKMLKCGFIRYCVRFTKIKRLKRCWWHFFNCFQLGSDSYGPLELNCFFEINVNHRSVSKTCRGAVFNLNSLSWFLYPVKRDYWKRHFLSWIHKWEVSSLPGIPSFIQNFEIKCRP